MDRNAVVWFEIYVLEKLVDPGPGVSEMGAFSGKPDNPGATGALVKMEGAPSGMGGVIIYFSCQDCAVECARVPNSGGKIMKDKFSIGQYGYIALVTDPEGNTVGQHSMK
jgi:predicted enzyme related to lactoylglutathione lyase